MPRSHSFRPRLEVMEARITPAGKISASFTKGVLTLNGDANNNQIQIENGKVPGTLVVTGLDGEQFIGLAKKIDQLTGIISVVWNAGDGNDLLKLGNLTLSGGLTINGGNGDNTVTFVSGVTVTLGGSLKVVNGTGVDSFDSTNVTALAAKSVWIDNGAGGATPSQTKLANAIIGTNLTVRAGSGDDHLDLSNVTVGKAASVKLGAGTSVIDLSSVTIGTQLLITGDVGDDAVNFKNNVFVGGNASLLLGSGTNVFLSDNLCIVNGNLKIVTQSSGNDMVELLNTIVGKNLIVSLADGFNETIIGGGISSIGGNVTVIGTNGDDMLQICDDTIIGGNVTFKAGAGTNLLEVSNGVQIGKKLAFIGGPLSSNDISISDGVVVGGATVLKVANGGSDVEILNSQLAAVTITATGGANMVTLDSSVMVGRVAMNLGNGGNLITIDPSTATSKTQIFGDLILTTGSLPDVIVIGAGQGVLITGKTSINTGNEVGPGDSVSIDDTTFLGAVSINTGGGDDTLQIEQLDTPLKKTLDLAVSFAGSFTLNMGKDNDQAKLGIDGNSWNVVQFGLKPLLNGGPGTNNLVINPGVNGGQVVLPGTLTIVDLDLSTWTVN